MRPAVRSRRWSAGLPRGGRRELGRALGDQAVPLADEGPVLELAGDDHLAAVPEGVRHGPRVAHRDRVGSVAIGDPEVELIAVVADRARDDVSGQLIRFAGIRVAQLRRLLRLAGGAE